MPKPTGPQFNEHRDTVDTGDIVVPQSRFAGVTGLAQDLGMPLPRRISRLGLSIAADAIGDAHGPAQDWHGQRMDFPIGNLMAQHHINRDNARTVFKSIKNRGYDPNEPIDVIADDTGYGVIFNGHHRALAARAAGLRTIPAIVTPFDRVASRLPSY
jgi:hypothetical protein